MGMPFVYSVIVIQSISLLLTLLAVVRVTRLIVIDRITLPIRSRILAKGGEEGWWTYLIHCPICASVWIAGAASPAWWYWHSQPAFLMVVFALAMAQIVAWLSKIDGV